MQILHGDWSCAKCAKIIHTGFQPKTCPVCGSSNKVITYAESSIIDTVTGYTGHCDGILKFGSFEGVFEFKTASASDFPNIDKPKIEHVVQSHAYMNGLKLDKTLIVYQNKGRQAAWTRDGAKWTAGKPEIKVFQINFDADYWKTYADRIRDWHKAGDFITKLGRPLVMSDAAAFTKLCANEQCLLATACPVVNVCFKLGD